MRLIIILLTLSINLFYNSQIVFARIIVADIGAQKTKEKNPIAPEILQTHIEKKDIKIPYSFADIVEPLISAVVNIYTERNVEKSPRNSDRYSSFGDLNDFFSNFDMLSRREGESYSDPRAISLGSGFIIDSAGYVVTNYHVIQNVDKIKVKLHDDSEFEAKIVGVDQRTDLALLKIDTSKDLSFVIFADDRLSRVGDWAIAIGNPFGLNQSVTAGIISSKARDIDSDRDGIVNNYIQTDAPINSGNSGGPLFDLNGKVIGVNTSIYSTSGSNAGVGFAIPSQTVQKVVEQLKKFGKVSRGLLNISINALTPDMIRDLGLDKDQKGVLVVEVYNGGAADKAGLKPGDVIVAINGKKVTSTRELQIMVAEVEINSTIKVSIIRNTKPLDLSTIITSEQTQNQLVNKAENKSKQMLDSDQLELKGVVFTNLNSSYIEKYGIDPKAKGVVVTFVEKSSSWSKHIKPGDLVVNVNYNNIASVKELDRACKETKDKKNIVFVIKRPNSSVFLSLPI